MTLPIRRLLLATTAAAVVLTGTPAYGVSTAAAPATAVPATAVDWQPCAEDKTADCAVLRVPVNWAKPNGETLGVALARRKAGDPYRRVGTLIVNSGGPSNSGVDFALSAADTFSPDVLARFDIVGFDPRGAARSQPVMCSSELISRTPAESPHNQAEFEQLLAFNAELGADCRRHAGSLIDHVDTISVVRDVDAIRRALGERKISFYGLGYGTLLGQQYAELFGRHVRAMVLDSNMDHSLGTRRFLLTQAATAEDSFNEFVAWCARDSACALHGQDVAAIWDGLLAKADRGELTDPADPSGGPISSTDLTFDAFIAFFEGSNWLAFADRIAMLDGQGRSAASSKLSPKAPSDPAEQLEENSFQAEFCQDWRFDIDNYQQFARLIAATRRVAPHMRGAAGSEVAMTRCLGWPTKVTNPQRRLKIHNAPKILMLNGLHDPSTGYNWATNVHQQIRNTAVLVTYEGAGRGVYGRSPCTVQITDRYLIGGVVPGEGSTCPAVSPAGPAPAAAPDASRAGARGAHPSH